MGLTKLQEMKRAVNATCYGERIGSVEEIQVRGDDNTLIHYWEELDPDGEIDGTATLELPVDLILGNYSILVGNDYIGYSEFVLSQSGDVVTQEPLDIVLLSTLVIATVGIIVVVVIILKWRTV